MSAAKPQAQLVLRSSDISRLGYQVASPNQPIERTVDFEDGNGFISKRQSLMIWKNINLRNVLGPLYKQGAMYNIQLTNTCFGLSSNLGLITTAEKDRAFSIFMKGLPFIYTSNGFGNRNEALLTNCRVSTGALPNIYAYNNPVFTFKTSQGQEDIVNLQIQFRDLLTDVQCPSSASTTLNYPNSTFVFSIYQV